jgi:peptide/nickel transport system substrate-binding protein
MNVTGASTCRQSRPLIEVSGLKRPLSILLAIALVAAGGCGRGHQRPAAPPTTQLPSSSGNADPGAALTVALAPAPSQWNPLTGGAGATPGSSAGAVGVAAPDATVVAAGVLPSAFVEHPNLTMSLDHDLLESAKVTITSPQTVVYRINPRAVWSDGTPITWQDFAYNWEAQSGRSAYRDVGGRPFDPATTQGYDDIDSVAPTGGNPDVVTVVFSSPYLDWRTLFTDLVPAHVAARVGFDNGFADPVDSLVSGGPFMVESYQPFDSLTLVRNPRWWGTPASLSSVTFDFVSSPQAAAAAFIRGEVGAVYLPATSGLVSTLKSGTAGQVSAAGSGTWEELEFNQLNPWLKNLAVRQAVMAAIDRPQMTSAVVGGIAPDLSPLDSRIWIPQQAGYADGSQGRYDHADLAAARADLARAALTLSNGVLTAGGRPVSLSLVASPTAAHQAEEQFIVKALSQLGIAVDVVDAVPDRAQPASYDMAIVDRSASPAVATVEASIGDPATVGHQNYSQANDPTVDRLLTEAAAAPGPSLRNRLLLRADGALWQDAESLPLFQLPTVVADASGDLGMSATAAAEGPAWNIASWGVPYQS